MKIVVFCPNLVGDAVMATPTLRALRAGFPNAEITGVAKPVVGDTLEGVPWVDRWIWFRPRSDDPSQRMFGVINRIRQESFDLTLLLPNSIRSGLMAWLGGVPRRIGFARGGRGILLTDPIPPFRDQRGRIRPTPIVQEYLKLAKRLGCPTDSTQPELFTSNADETKTDEVWRSLGISPGDQVVSLNTGGAFGPSKNWPEESFATLARRLVSELKVRVLVLCGPSERNQARKIAALADHPDVLSLDQAPVGIGLSKASIRRSILLVTTDSGPRHFANAFRVPVITLFGPTWIAWTRTDHPRAIHLQQPVPCGPCQRSTCPEGHNRCMTELDPATVFEACQRLISGKLVA